MLETKDTAIKLFGKTIPLPPNEEFAAFFRDRDGGENHEFDLTSTNSKEEESNKGVEQNQTEEKDQLSIEAMETDEKDGTLPEISEVTDCAMSMGINENLETDSTDKETVTPKNSKTEDEPNETGISQEKILKRPDKILPCPRCNSMDTKFCYYNNYNVNQPRHFCKNCQRYWTAGGTMRNVPVGAGRRKNKNSASHYRHITVSEVLQTARTHISDGIHQPSLKHNGTVLTFGSETPLCESIASVLNIADKTTQNNGFRRPEELKIPDSCGWGENGDQNSNRSSIASSNPIENGSKIGLQEPRMQTYHGFPPQIPCFPGTPWAQPWNTAQWSSSIPPPSTFCPPTFPIPFYHATPYWGWSYPWPSQPNSSPNNVAWTSSPNSPTLGKHSRNGDMLKPSISEKEDPTKQSNSERSLWIPKTLRIDDPEEAARSSIWATLGIKNDKANTISRGGLFKAFKSKGDDKNQLSETSQMLQANPAALCRSLNFHETL